MPFWSSILFNDANSPIMEQMIFFHDHVIIIITIIISMILYIMLNIYTNKFYNYYMLDNHELEVIWTLIPTILLIFIAMPSLRLLYIMEETYSFNSTIKIIGHQWYWSYELTDFNIEFDSFMIPESNMKNSNNFRLLDTDNSLTLPMNTFSNLLITAADVIHAWTIPSLGIKMDAIPGRLNHSSFYSFRPGQFFGQCSEICGSNHSFMPILMEITSLKNFLHWIKLN